MMTPETFQRCQDNIWERIRSLEKEAHDLNEERKKFEAEYAEEALKASRFAVGQKITDDRGRTWFISGAHTVDNHVYLSLNPPKKDGTMSKVTFIGRSEPHIKIF